MRFTVVWTSHAEHRLASLWLDSRFRWHISEVTNALDRLLATQPEKTGESRDGHRRITFIFPLAFTFEIDDQNRIVRVLDVWSF